VFINSDQRASMTFFFSTGGGATGSNAGAATGSVPAQSLNEFRQFVQHSPSGLGSPQTAHGGTAGWVSLGGAAADTRSRPQHTQWRSGESVSF
jgi:hypothetical protein